jgi:lambda repressor-like predicted transcriptional regulator
MNISDLLKDPEKAKEVLDLAIRTQNKELAEILIPVVKDPYLIYRYADRIAKRKIKDEWEDIIAQDSYASYDYANYILKGPFPKGEDAIAQKPFTSYHYVKNVLHGPFPKGEDAIAKDLWYSYFYAQNFLKDRFKKGEKVIIGNRDWLNKYIDFLKKIGKLDEFLNDHPEVKDRV